MVGCGFSRTHGITTYTRFGTDKTLFTPITIQRNLPQANKTRIRRGIGKYFVFCVRYLSATDSSNLGQLMHARRIGASGVRYAFDMGGRCELAMRRMASPQLDVTPQQNTSIELTNHKTTTKILSRTTTSSFLSTIGREISHKNVGNPLGIASKSLLVAAQSGCRSIGVRWHWGADRKQCVLGENITISDRCRFLQCVMAPCRKEC